MLGPGRRPRPVPLPQHPELLEVSTVCVTSSGCSALLAWLAAAPPSLGPSRGRWVEARLGELGEGEEEAGPEDGSVGLLWARRERGRGVPEGQPGVSPGRALLRGLKVRHLEAGGTLIFLGRGQSVKEPPGHQCPVRWSQVAGAAAAWGAGAGAGAAPGHGWLLVRPGFLSHQSSAGPGVCARVPVSVLVRARVPV